MGLVRSVDLAELRAFCAAVDLGSLGSAARLLRVSQPALSKRMRALEALAGAQLLVRSSRGIATTEAGERLYVEARKLLAQADAVEELMAGLSNEDAPVRLAVSHTIAEFVLPGRLVEYEQLRGRHLSVELVIANSVVVRDLVARRAGGIRHSCGPDRALRSPASSRSTSATTRWSSRCPDGHPWAAARGDRAGAARRRAARRARPEREHAPDRRRGARRARADARPAARRGGQHERGEGDGDRGARAGAPLGDRGRPRRRGLRRQARARARPRPRQFVLLLGSQESVSPAARALVDHLLRKP